MRILRSEAGLSLAISTIAPSSTPLRPAFQASATRIPYASIGSGAVEDTINTKIWLPRCCS